MLSMLFTYHSVQLRTGTPGILEQKGISEYTTLCLYNLPIGEIILCCGGYGQSIEKRYVKILQTKTQDFSYYHRDFLIVLESSMLVFTAGILKIHFASPVNSQKSDYQ